LSPLKEQRGGSPVRKAFKALECGFWLVSSEADVAMSAIMMHNMEPMPFSEKGSRSKVSPTSLTGVPLYPQSPFQRAKRLYTKEDG